MANDRGGGRGSFTAGGVRGTMKSPFGKATNDTRGSGGTYGRNKAPFDQPQGMGNGSIPTKFYEPITATAPRTMTAGQVSPPIGATQRVTERRFKNPK